MSMTHQICYTDRDAKLNF